MMLQKIDNYFKGRGAQINPHNRFNTSHYVNAYPEVIDEPLLQTEKTEHLFTYPKTIINKVESTDLGFGYSLNPYQGCEHGCVYCYARNSHEFWGYSAGLDFERKIIIKKNAVELLEKQFSQKNWKVKPIMLSGNTDCYQPIEKELQLTRRILQLCLKYKHPVSIVTKNALITRDLDVLVDLAALNLVQVHISITGTDEKTRLLLEPRTSTYKNRLATVKLLSEHHIPCGVLIAPIIPGINNHEIPSVVEQAAQAGANYIGISIVRLNGTVAQLFKDWLEKNYPDRADKVWNQISECHGGNVADSRPKIRLKGQGKIAESIMQLFDVSMQKFLPNATKLELDTNLFDYKAGDTQLSLF